MAEFARVESVEALQELRAALVKFAAAADQALVAADAEIGRGLEWVRREQASYWRHQVRRRTEVASRAKLELTHKRAFPTATGGTASVIDEERAFRRAERALEEAEMKVRAVSAWGARLEKERHLYRGATSSMRAVLERDVPAALADLAGMADSLEAYLSEAPPDSAPTPTSAPRPPEDSSQEDRDESGNQ